MAVSEVQICNVALAKIGVRQQIAALTDPGVEAGACSLFFDWCRDSLLTRAEWSFATKRQAMELSAVDPPVEWGFRYVKPSDCLFARSIDDERRVRRVDQRIPFAIEGTDILCDLEMAVLIYTRAITDVRLFPPWFDQALAWYLASEIATPLSLSPTVAQLATQSYMRALDQALASGFAEATPDEPPQSEFITQRL